MATIVETRPSPPQPRLGRARALRAQFTDDEWRRIKWMFGSITFLHVLGFGIFIAFVVPSHYRGMGIGVSVLAYTLGLRHAFDADHISAIDNTTRKLMHDRHGVPGSRKPLSIGYWFSLGHSSIVVAVGLAIVVAAKAVFGQVQNSHSALQQFGGLFGTIISASFLYLIAAMNIVILGGIVKVWRSMRNGEFDEAELERQLQNRGFMYRFFGRIMRSIKSEWQMYPVGVLFGLGFDTATEVLLLGSVAAAATEKLPWYAIVCLPILFTAGMSLMDTIDGCFMNIAYGWAFFNPVRRVYYNLAITGLSIAICFIVGTIEVMQLLPIELNWHGSFWNAMTALNINTAGFVIVGLFVLTWISAMLIWRYGNIEEKWSANLLPANESQVA